MDGKEFVDILEEFGVRLSPATKSQWRTKTAVSPTIMRNALSRARVQALTAAIEPIVEFHPLNHNHKKNVDSFASRIDSEKITVALKSYKGGIYCFYDASGRIVYIGKTEKNSLFAEMEQRCRGKNVHIKLLVRGKSAKPMHKVADLAMYISAYYVDQHLISDVEALLTRVVLNNAANLKVESFGRKKAIKVRGR